MSDDTYKRWIATIKATARIQMEQGMLGVLAAKTNIPEGRLRDWIEKKTIDDLMHGELTALHKALCPPEEQANVVSESEEQRNEELAKSNRSGKFYTRTDRLSSFDESD
jgi:hypothetical protein